MGGGLPAGRHRGHYCTLLPRRGRPSTGGAFLFEHPDSARPRFVPRSLILRSGRLLPTNLVGQRSSSIAESMGIGILWLSLCCHTQTESLCPEPNQSRVRRADLRIGPNGDFRNNRGAERSAPVWEYESAEVRVFETVSIGH